MTDFSHADRSPQQRLRRFMVRGLRSLVLGPVISLVFVLLFAQHFWSALIYSTSIAFCCWFFIDGGRIVVASWVNPPQEIERRGQWPGWPWMVAILLIGTVLGYSIGNAFGNWVTGNNAPGIIASHPRQALGLLVFSLLPGIAATYFFFSRERFAASEARAQKAQREAAENQLRLLESQLEPHMLFNTLANLRVLIGTDPARAQAMLDQLIGFLRATLNASRAGAHPLQAEFARLSDYLALMKVRMGERLQSRFELPEALAHAPVPPLIL
jgi:Histidine kinase